MKFELFIAKRYLVRGRKSSFISIISLVSIIGITIGVAALIIALALISGFQNDVRNKILSATAHIMVNDRFGEGLSNWQSVEQTITGEINGIRYSSPVVYGTVLLRGSVKNVMGAIMRGIHADRTQQWQAKIREGHFPEKENEIMIGSEISATMGLFPGDKLIVIIPRAQLSPSGITPKWKSFLVCGIFHTGLYEFDNTTILTTMESAQKQFGLQGRINYIQVDLEDIFSADEKAEKLRAVLPDHLSVITWKELNASLYSALKLEKTVLFFTLTLIIVVASLNIIAGLILLVIQKIKDIGILLSYGAKPRTIRRIFFFQGGIIGVLGTFTGTLLGLGFCWFGNKFELIKVPPDIYQMSHVPFRIGFIDLSAIVLATLLISLTATLIPSKKAASVDVVDAVKSE